MVGMSVFFYLLPLEFKKQNTRLRVAQILGVAAMLNFLFLFTTYHDLVVLISGCLGLFVILFFIREYLAQAGSIKDYFGALCLALSFCVFISFQFKIGIDILPVFQRFVFVMDSIWVFISCYSMSRMMPQTSNHSAY